RLVHQLAEPAALRLSGWRQQQFSKRLRAAALVHGVCRRRAYAIAPAPLNRGDGVHRTAVAIEELVAAHLVRQISRERPLKVVGADVGQVPAGYRNVLGEKAQPHERPRADGTVLRSAHGVALTGTDPPQLEIVR